MCEAIDSALAQTYPNIEIIVVNDGSTDDTEKLALAYGDRIRYFSKKNGGVATALNLGIEQMRGDYFSWLSHDDVYYPQKVERQIYALRDIGFSKSIVFSNIETYHVETGVISISHFEEQFGINKLQNGIFPVLFGLASGCSLLIQSSHFKRVGLFDTSLSTAQDVDMWFRMFRKQKTLFCREALIRIRLHPAQGSRTILTFSDEENNIHAKHFGMVSDAEITQLFGNAFMYCYFMMKFYAEHNLYEVYKIAYERYRVSDIPDSLCNKIRRIKTFVFELYGSEPDEVCVLGAGSCGRACLVDLEICGIQVKCFADNDKTKWGDIIQGKPCIPVSDVDVKNTFIIVAIRENAAVFDQLLAMDARYVSDYKKFELCGMC